MTRRCKRKHTPIVSRSQQRLFGAELSRRMAGEKPLLPSISTRELKKHLEESRDKDLPEYTEEETKKGRKYIITPRMRRLTPKAPRITPKSPRITPKMRRLS